MLVLIAILIRTNSKNRYLKPIGLESFAITDGLMSYNFAMRFESDVTPKSWTVYLICFDVVSCIVQDSCRA